MIEVDLPDGTIAEFPDGTPNDVIQGALQRKFASTPAPQTATTQSAPAQEDQALLSELSQMTLNPAKAQYDQLPAWQKPIQAASDIAALGMDGVTMGYGDKAAAGLRSLVGNGSYDENLARMRGQTQGARDRAGSAGLVAEVGGSLAIPVAAASRGATLAGRLGTGTMTGAKGVAARAAILAPEAALYGAAQAGGHDEDVKTGAALGLASGALGSVAGDAIGAGITKASQLIKGTNKVPDLAGLRAAAKSAYDKADNAGVIIKPEGIQRVANDVRSELADFGYHPELQPRVAVVVKELDRLGEGNVTLKGVDVLRRIADNARKSIDPSEKALGNKIINKIDDFVGDLKPQDVLAGDAVAGANALKQARSIWSRVSKNERLLDAVNKAELRASSTGSGGNVENATRQNIRKLLEKGRGFTPDEKSAMEEIVRGTPGQNLLRLAGKLSPSGNGLMAALGIGGTMANPMVGAAVLGGMGAKAIADRGVTKAVQSLDELIRSGGNAAAMRAAKGQFAKLTKTQKDTIARLFMASGVVGSQQANQ